jgi:tetratricopeptide (TPR) repeat protein
MSPELWARVESLYSELADLPAAEQARRLEAIEDAELRWEVRSLLDAGGFTVGVSEAIAGVAAQVVGDTATPFAEQPGQAPTRFGPYEIQRELGAGGMGRVYLAARADDQYRKLVAIKVVRAGLADPASRERFLQERQILASLDHPYIARLLDGGTAPDGSPYLVLDYVDGHRITAYCKESKLGIADRCRLFIKVCEAVAFAHQNLVVHRDLKPGNILVTADGTPKLLDFGIAKLLGEGGHELTRTAYGLLTPQYASPEQVKGEPVTTATDVYSLGAILFELLAGSAPHRFDTESVSELVRVICEQDVQPPSKVAPQRVPRDLDNIVLKAMAKDPRRRYSSAEHLAEDVVRHLELKPVRARGDSPLYRLSRFCRRRWMPLAAAAALLATLSGAVVQSRAQARIADQLRVAAVRERDRAEAERARAEQAAREAMEQRAAAVASSQEATAQRGRADQRFDQLRNLIQRFLFDIDTAVADLPGTSNARRVLAKTSLEYLDAMARETGRQSQLQRDIAVAYERVGELQGSTTKPSLGDKAGALASYRKAAAIRRSMPLNSLANRLELMNLYNNMTVVLRDLGQRPEAARLLDDGLKLRQGPWRDDPVMLLTAAGLLFQRAGLSEISGDIKVAVQSYRETADLYSRVASFQPGNRKAHDGLAQANYLLGVSLCRADDYADGLPRLREGMAAAAELTRLEPTSVQYPRLLAIITRAYANNLADRNAGPHRNLDEALTHMRRAMEINKALHEKDASNRIAYTDYIRAVGAVGRVHSLRDEWEPSARWFDQSRLMMEGLFKQYPQDTRLADDTAYFTLELAMSLSFLKRYDEAIAMLDRSQTIYEDLLAKQSNSRFARFNRALAIRKSGEIDALRGNKAEGRRKIEEALKVFEDLNRLDPTMKMYAAQIAETLKSLAGLDKD